MNTNTISLFAIGMMVGLADLIPGISGGSVAFVSGIYGQLLDMIDDFARGRWKNFRWSFALPLLSGLFLSATLFSVPIHYSLLHYQIETYAFFLATMFYSIILFFKQQPLPMQSKVTALPMGIVFTIALTFCVPQVAAHSLIWIAFAGFCGAIAMLAPGISGSYVLCFLGVYPQVLESLSHLYLIQSWLVIIAFAIGTIGGLVVASSILRFLLSRYPSLTIGFLGGALIGGLPVLMIPLLKAPWLFPLSLTGAIFLYLLTPRSLKKYA